MRRREALITLALLLAIAGTAVAEPEMRRVIQPPWHFGDVPDTAVGMLVWEHEDALCIVSSTFYERSKTTILKLPGTVVETLIVAPRYKVDEFDEEAPPQEQRTRIIAVGAGGGAIDLECEVLPGGWAAIWPFPDTIYAKHGCGTSPDVYGVWIRSEADTCNADNSSAR